MHLAVLSSSPTGPAKRRIAENLGRNAEADVASAWQDKGFTVLAQRLRTGAGEIDLVVADQDTLVFVEVKARRSFVEAAYSVSPRQQLRLLNAASAALATHEHWERPSIRFDVALVAQGSISHIEDAIRYN